jgi:hypothetical protein
MKKMIVLLAFALTVMATQAFADTAMVLTNLKGFNKTNKITVTGNKNTSLDAWSAASAHEAGDKEFATSSAYGGIVFKIVNPGATNGTSAPAAPSTSTDSSVPAGGYTTM